MNVSSQPLFASASQPSKLPIPRLPSIPTSSWSSSSTSTNPIIPNAQQNDNATQQQTTNKPQNKRGRKPLSSMPTTKKHIQNLNNQRAFRQRRETYIQQVDIEERINICNNVGDLRMSSTAVNDENIRTHNIQSQNSRCFTPFATTNTPPPFSFNDQHRLINQPPQISCSVPMLPPLESIGSIRDPIFCETKEDKCSNDKSVTDKRMWILPTIPSSLYSNYSPNLELPHQQNYFSPVSSVVTTTNSFYPLNLKWILSDSG
ncbi:19431_t:CDS:2 [Rhizophagus irregularis]|nr:19431_t:CDS:2 [Rhizophagus irregularis]